MKLHETLKEAGNIIVMLETRNFTPQQMQEIMHIISGILASKIATDTQQGMLQKTIGAMVNDMENKFKKSTKKKRTQIPFIAPSPASKN